MYVNNADIPIVIMYIGKFHCITFEPSNGGIGNKLNNARKLFTLNPNTRVNNSIYIIPAFPSDKYGLSVNVNPKNNTANIILTIGPAMDIFPFSSAVTILPYDPKYTAPGANIM